MPAETMQSLDGKSMEEVVEILKAELKKRKQGVAFKDFDPWDKPTFDSITEIDFRGHSIKETLTINGDWSETEHKHMVGWQALPQSSISEAWFISHQEMLDLGDPASTLPPGGRRLSSVVKSIRSPSRILSAPTPSTSTGQDYFKIETGLELDGDGRVLVAVQL